MMAGGVICMTRMADRNMTDVMAEMTDLMTEMTGHMTEVMAIGTTSGAAVEGPIKGVTIVNVVVGRCIKKLTAGHRTDTAVAEGRNQAGVATGWTIGRTTTAES